MPISKINTTSITDNSVTAGKIVAGAVDADIAAGSIDTAQIADDAVTTVKITDANITTAKIADDAVTADKLANAINTSIAAKAPIASPSFTGNVGIGLATPLAPVVALTTVTSSEDDIVYGMTQSNNNAGRLVGMGIAATGSVANMGVSFYTCLSSVQSERMRINEQGRMGIGTTSPQADLHIGNADGASRSIVVHTENNGDARLRFREGSTVSSGFNEYSFGMDGGDNALTWEQQGNGEIARFTSDGNLVLNGTVAGTLSTNTAGLTIYETSSNAGISYQSGGASTDHYETYASQSARFYIENTNTSNGAYLQYNSSSGWTNVSDQRWKTDWTLLGDSSSKITDLNIGKYHMLNGSKETIDGAKWDYGVKAQELLEVIPDAVDVPLDPEDKYGVVPNIVFWHTVKALQEALAKIDAMETRLSTLEDA